MPQSEPSGAPREQRLNSQQFPPAAVPNVSNLPLSNNATGPPPMTENVRGRTLTYEDLSRCFHLPINAAAKELGVCVTALKKQCRKHGVPRWPHRKLKSLDKLKEKLEKEEATAADKEYYKHEIHSITQKKDHIFRSSSTIANSSNVNGSAPLAHPVGAPPPGSLHPRPGHPLVLGHHPIPGYHHAPLPPKIAGANVPSRNPGTGETDRQQQQQQQSHQQHIIAGPVLMPVAQIPGAGAATTTIAGPNGTLIHQPIQGHPQHYSLCGIYGCDCYMNNGVSSRMYHAPIPVPRPNGTATPNGAVPSHASALPNVHYFNPPAYTYAPTMTSMAPYQNMVQVNLVEQSAFNHGSNRAGQASTTPGPSGQIDGKAGTNSSGQQKGLTKHPGKPMGFEMYGGIPQPVSSHNGIMYNFVPHNVHYEGMVQHQPNGAPMPVPGYWSEMQHSQTPASNLVTMCNQTVHHHHHHGSAPASPCLAQKDPSEKQDVDNASSKTNESQRMDVSTDEKNVAKSGGATNSVDVQSKNIETSRAPNQSHSSAPQTQLGLIGRESEKQEAASIGRKVERNASSIPSIPTQKTMVSSLTQSESKAGNSEVCANGYTPKGLPNGTKSHATSDSTCYSSRSDENKQNEQGSTKRPNKRLRTQLTPEQKELPNGRRFSVQGMERTNLTKMLDVSESEKAEREAEKEGRMVVTTGGSSSVPNGKPHVVQNTHGSRKEGPVTTSPSATASVMNRARRYDHVVHQCLALASAQWCTDVSFKVTLALGPKAMLGLAGVPSLGKNVLEGTETALEDRASIKKRYVMAAEGKRLEWIATHQNSRYLIVMNPYRKRNSKDVVGVSGLMVELKIIQAL